MLRFLRLSALLACASLVLPASAAPAETPPNVLFIAVDDLNHWVGHLKRNPQTLTPNLDRLASRGVSFIRAYCVAPACNPSRAALMSGLRPSTTGVYQNRDDWRPRIDSALTLPSFFRRHGYSVSGAGKIYHGAFERRSEWDDYFERRRGRETQAEVEGEGNGVGTLKFRRLEAGDDVMNDHHVVNYCIERLGRRHEKPFFLACGIYRPHLPWNVPKKYFDLHPLEDIDLPPHRPDDLEDLPAAGTRMARPNGDHASVTDAGLWKELVRAYLASISYADAEVGRLLDALDRSPHRDNTVIVLWGDHGWHLGEKSHWRKFALWEEATRTPLIWIVPGLTEPGRLCNRPVDLLSIYPTLAEVCGFDIPAHVEGTSIHPLLKNPDREWSRPALTTHGAGNHAVRSERWRYIRYAGGGEELYDHSSDPFEWTNLADQPEHRETKEQLGRSFPGKP